MPENPLERSVEPSMASKSFPRRSALLDHKTLCRSLEGGGWYTLNVSPHMKDRQGNKLHTAFMSTKGAMKPPSAVISPTNNETPLPMELGDKAFLMKIQNSATAADLPGYKPSGDEPDFPPTLLIYDRHRSFRMHAIAKDNKKDEVWKKVWAQVISGENPRKVYRCALKRSGDYSFSVCLDKAPDVHPGW